MSLPESFTYGSAIGAQTAINGGILLNKANFGKYVAATNLVDNAVTFSCNSTQRKDGVLDSWMRFERFRNFSPYMGGAYVNAEQQSDRLLSVQLRVIAPLSTNSNDGRFTQQDILDHTRSMGSVLYEANFIERLLRGEL